MRASVEGGISGAAARAAGPESLSPRKRPENASVERVLRMFDGNGFSESDKVGRPSDPKPETIQYKEREREGEREQQSGRLDPGASLFIPSAVRKEREERAVPGDAVPLAPLANWRDRRVVPE